MNAKTTILITAGLLGSSASALQLSLTPDRAMYRPGEAVTLTLSYSAAERPRPLFAKLSITHLRKEVYTQSFPLDASGTGTNQITWTPPATPTGYGASIEVTDEESDRVWARIETAFDVHEVWTERPRYGFLSDFGPADEQDTSRVQSLAAYHVNALQFYDWMYRHDNHFPPTDVFIDPLNRTLSMHTVRQRIDEAHQYGMAAMPYTTIYGASVAYGDAHPDQTFYKADGTMWYFMDNFLTTMNPANQGWRDHILSEYRRILETEPFDGLHIDQYGDPKIAYDQQGNEVDLAPVIPGFLQDAKKVASGFKGRETVIFNLVNDWPNDTVTPSGVDMTYVEVWPPHNDYPSLRDIIYHNQELSRGKPVVLAAYLTAKADAATRLLDSVIAASGGSHLELGEDVGLLGDPYFPKYENPSQDLKNWLKRYYDFTVRYQDVLYSGTPNKTLEEIKVTSHPFSVGDYPSRKIWGLGRNLGNGQVFHLINLMQSPAPIWKFAQPDLKVQHNIQVQVQRSKPVGSVWVASPDQHNGSPIELKFTQSGSTVTFTVPELNVWTMIVLEDR
ncbi:glycoside hydrolase family 66 protein [Deinococcus roseus]|uniref:Cycloisomaltooligosaccharide glucanotransferase n=1 Tax=Deinococcus roseus TaxID=392414 RepID=A0ABQ2D725_9DEIO|nr:glycoside hydrolase family 66 protein [Deinococcus roseus]GGJ47336.1 cycloisomaltooligosaccharide glucanotransferase [Deinococcus roseus]